jgi:hypothetical protein
VTWSKPGTRALDWAGFKNYALKRKKKTILIYNNLFNFLEQSIIMLSMSNHVIIRKKMKISSNL